MNNKAKLILNGGQWQNGIRAGELYVKCGYYKERELGGLPSHNEDWDDMPQRWLAIMHVANYGKTVNRRMRIRK